MELIHRGLRLSLNLARGHRALRVADTSQAVNGRMLASLGGKGLYLVKGGVEPFPYKVSRLILNLARGRRALHVAGSHQTVNGRKLASLGGKGLYLVRTNPEKTSAEKTSLEPFQITIDVSAYCNARCPFCPRESLPMDPNLLRGFMKKEMFYDIMRQVLEWPSIKTISFGMLGEPLMHPDIDEFVDYTVSHGYRVMFPSNMGLAHRHFDTLMKLDNIMFSIEGHDKESYESLRKKLKFDVVYQNLKRFDEMVREKKAKGERTPLRVLNFIVTKKSDIQAYLDLWGHLADDIRIGPMGHPLVWDNDKGQFVNSTIKGMEDDILPLLTKVENMQCVQPSGIITVRADGKLVLCCSDTGSKLDFGDVTNLKETYNNNVNLNAVREQFRKKDLHVCKNCFENYGITKDDMMGFFPQLREVKDEKVTVYFNR